MKKTDIRQKTKVVATLGPATKSRRMVERLVRAGADVVRINLSHGTPDLHREAVRDLRAVADRLGRPVGVLLDVPGPRYRTGDLRDGQVTLKKGTRLVLTTRDVPGDQHEVSVNSPYLVTDVRVGDSILLDDGAIRLTVRLATDTDLVCRVAVGGVLKPRRGIALPGVQLSAPFITDQTIQQIRMAAEENVDFLALSFVTRSSDIHNVRAVMADAGCTAMVIAKIERQEAVRGFDRILEEADGTMVARGDLGVEMPLEKVPLVQKTIIRKCNRAGKPVITATQMLESMMNYVRPTRAEVADVANAVYDGTDAVMLSGETAVGSYPVEAVAMMSRIARETETGLPYERRMAERGADLIPQTDDAIAYAACHTAHQLGAKAILAFTQSGSTAWRVCKYRPRVPIVGITPDEAVRRRLALAWGVHSHRIEGPATVDDLFRIGRALARELKLAREGDLVVITGGVPMGVKGTTNLLKVQQV